ncbi:hypothetical protein [Actinomadura sp. 9N215]|uniref:hypothetical protein n=1 Tax=Actinomadura sp. 9N215 TaxID=3375150 RepID=UPI0037B1C59E
MSEDNLGPPADEAARDERLLAFFDAAVAEQRAKIDEATIRRNIAAIQERARAAVADQDEQEDDSAEENPGSPGRGRAVG